MEALGGKHKESVISQAAVEAIHKFSAELKQTESIPYPQRAAAIRKVLIDNAGEKAENYRKLFKALDLKY